MSENLAIIDTCFVEKLSSEGKELGTVTSLLDDMDYIPVVHPYVAEQEMSLRGYMKKMIENGTLRKIEYSEFLKDKNDKEYYKQLFFQLHTEFADRLNASGGIKHVEHLDPSGFDIFSQHRAGSSVGDVHMMLMALFMRLPIIVTEDSDIELLRGLARDKISMGIYHLQVYDTVELVLNSAKKKDSKLTSKELKHMLDILKKKEFKTKIDELRKG